MAIEKTLNFPLMNRPQLISLFAMVALYFAAGINHFINPGFYIDIMPEWFPAKNTLNTITGVAEILLAIGLISVATRGISAWLIIIMLVLFLAVHFDHLINPPELLGEKGALLALFRLPLQLILIWWAYKVSTYR